MIEQVLFQVDASGKVLVDLNGAVLVLVKV
jgi:hypothetical protein